MASGLLPIFLGEATKFAGILSEADKAYEVTLRFGRMTTTGDAEGDLIEERKVGRYSDKLPAALQHLRGNIHQVPPMHSALKRGGVPLYKLAHKGIEVPREPRPIQILELTPTSMRTDELDLYVRCSKGTYIRTLGEDIGRDLGCGATVKRLRRVSIGPFTLADALDLQAVETTDSHPMADAIKRVDAALDHLPRVDVDERARIRLQMGQVLPRPLHGSGAGLVRLYDCASQAFLGLGELGPEGLRPVRLMSTPSTA